MQTADRTEFLGILNGLAAIKPNAKLTPQGIDMWWRVMQTWTLEEFRNAASHLALSEEFMPNPWHFEQLRKAGRLTPGEAWERARRASGSAIRGGHVTHNGTCGDELIDRALRAIGGYGVIAMTDTDKLPFLERRFAEHFESIRDADATREAIPQIAYSGSGPRLPGARAAATLLPRGMKPA